MPCQGALKGVAVSIRQTRYHDASNNVIGLRALVRANGVNPVAVHEQPHVDRPAIPQ
jgi:hypothetical protein